MRGSQKNFLQQIRVNIRFIFPRINNRITYPACLQRIKQSQCLYYFSTRSIHNKRFPLQTGKEIRIRQMERFIFPIPVQRSMKGYYITFPCQYRQIHKFRFPPGPHVRIIQQTRIPNASAIRWIRLPTCPTPTIPRQLSSNLTPFRRFNNNNTECRYCSTLPALQPGQFSIQFPPHHNSPHQYDQSRWLQ